MRPKGLGRGLDALLGADETPRGALATIETARIRPGRYQPRTRMDEQALAELAQSIRAQGLLQPVVVRPVAGGYELIAGERRDHHQDRGRRELPSQDGEDRLLEVAKHDVENSPRPAKAAEV